MYILRTSTSIVHVSYTSTVHKLSSTVSEKKSSQLQYIAVRLNSYTIFSFSHSFEFRKSLRLLFYSTLFYCSTCVHHCLLLSFSDITVSLFIGMVMHILLHRIWQFSVESNGYHFFNFASPICKWEIYSLWN